MSTFVECQRHGGGQVAEHISGDSWPPLSGKLSLRPEVNLFDLPIISPPLNVPPWSKRGLGLAQNAQPISAHGPSLTNESPIQVNWGWHKADLGIFYESRISGPYPTSELLVWGESFPANSNLGPLYFQRYRRLNDVWFPSFSINLLL